MIFTNDQGVLEHDTFTPVPGTKQPNWAELHRLNRVWREWMDTHSQFATPDTIDSLRYARIEANEAADLELRQKLPAHARNNERNHTIPGELAQVVMLLLTALPTIDFALAEREGLCLSDLPRLDDICDLANSAVIECAAGFDYWTGYAHALLRATEHWPGLDIAAELRRCWSALAWKHASYHMHEYPEELK